MIIRQVQLTNRCHFFHMVLNVQRLNLIARQEKYLQILAPSDVLENLCEIQVPER